MASNYKQKNKNMAIVVWEFHELVANLRELAGYRDFNIDPEFDDDVEHLAYLRKLDPTKWKEHDFYAILGLKKLRHRATPLQIKNAYRKLILCHHPDKNKEMHTVFISIQKAYDFLSEPDQRKSYDSVDPVSDDALPSEDLVKSDFYNTLNYYFDLNAKWSRKVPVPQLGDDETPYDKVERFYAFWYEFDTWREFSFLDEEETQDGANREERRYIDRLNKAERVRRRQEEIKRIRKLVDMAFNNDPRIKRKKQQEKDEKEGKKKAKQEAALARKKEYAERQRLEKEKEEEAQRKKLEAERIAKEELKRLKEAQKNALKRERKLLRNFVEKNNYFINVENGKTTKKSGDDRRVENLKVERMHCLELLCTSSTIEKLLEINAYFADSSGHNVSEHRDYFLTIIDKNEKELEIEKHNMNQQMGSMKLSNGDNGATPQQVPEDGKWTFEVNQCLVRAVNSIPAGSPNRWDSVAQFINTHIADANITGKDVLKRMKVLKSCESNLKSDANTHSADFLKQNSKASEAVKKVVITDKIEAASSVPWTAEEQKQLEVAIKKFPNGTESRWDKIADHMTNRTKEECFARFKYLAEMLKARKLKNSQTTK